MSDETGGDWDGRGWGPQVAFRSDHVRTYNRMREELPQLLVSERGVPNAQAGLPDDPSFAFHADAEPRVMMPRMRVNVLSSGIGVGHL